MSYVFNPFTGKLDNITGINNALPGGTAGSVLFVGSGGVIAQNNSSLFWDNTNNRLGIGTASPSNPLSVVKNFNGETIVNVTNTNAGSGADATMSTTSDTGTGAMVTFSSTNSYGPALGGSSIFYSGNSKDLVIMADGGGSMIFANRGSVPALEVARFETTYGLKLGVTGALTGVLKFGGLTSGTITVKPADIAGTYTLTLPTTGGTTGYPLVTTDGAGTLAFQQLSLTAGVTGVLPPANGGTGIVNNAASTLTISGNFATTLTVSAATSVTLPTSGTLATLAGSEILTNKTLSGNIATNFIDGSGHTVTFPAITGTLPIIVGSSGTASSTTNSASETNLKVITLPILGANDKINIIVIWKMTGTASTKTPTIRHSTTSGDTSAGTVVYSSTLSGTTISAETIRDVWNANSVSSQIMMPSNSIGVTLGSSTTPTTGAINTGATSYININGAVTNSGDTIQVVGYTVTIYPGV